MLIDSGLEQALPGVRVLELEMEGLVVQPLDARLESLKGKVIEETKAENRTLDDIKDEPVFRAYRDFYWKVGVDPTKTRPAGEALARRILGGKDIPAINTVVDAYNLVSLKTSSAIAAFDSGQVASRALKLRKARVGENFRGIGMAQPVALKGPEVVIEDEQSRDLVAVYPYRNAEKSKVTELTHGVLLMMCGVPGISDAQLETARDLCREYISEFCQEKRASGPTVLREPPSTGRDSFGRTTVISRR
jgi:DNA/RNA-binding domain of Phe-tRNA-synthetase-like protein